jgi:uracil-DNA glycosylase
VAVVRPIDLLLEFLHAEEAQGVTHVHLDDGARDGLRDLFLRSRAAPASPIAPPPPPQRPKAAAAPAPAAPAAQAPPPAVRLADGSRSAQLAALSAQAASWAPAKSLGSLREKMVFSAGNPEARLMLIGDAPGYDEERFGRPFAGEAGQKLTLILKAMGIERDEVYITYLVKFRPSTPNQTINNRNPTRPEIDACLPLLRAELGIVKPECVIGFGASSAEGLLGIPGTVAELRGKWHAWEGTPLRITHAPGHLLQESETLIKRQLWEDMLAVMEQLKLPISEKQRGFFQPKA